MGSPCCAVEAVQVGGASESRAPTKPQSHDAPVDTDFKELRHD
jgi:hypothetical protein